MSSGVPQGSVLGPLLFLIYINDLPSAPLSPGTNIVLYADDILLYREISCQSDYEFLQSDILLISQWVNSNHLRLNEQKCKYMIVSRLMSRQIPPTSPLTINNNPLERVSCYKYLGVTFSETLRWSDHILNISSKAKRLLGLIYRQYSRHFSQASLLKLYIFLVRPHLEYASQVWNPHLQKDVLMLESVQKFALKICLKEWHLPYHDCLIQCCLPDLKTRREILNLCLYYKYVNNLCDFPDFSLQRRMAHYPHRSTAAFIVPRANSNYFQSSFFVHTAKLWNQLPLSVTSAPSLRTFKTKLYDHFLFS